MLIQPIHSDHADYLRDESRRSGQASHIAFPETEADVLEVLRFAASRAHPVTLQGARTGITAGAVPGQGLILNLSRMKKVLGMRYDESRERFFITVQPGVVLSELREALHHRSLDTTAWTPESLKAWMSFQESPHFFFPPDPTETTASIGGMIACNASGARTFLYGPTRRYVSALKVILAEGQEFCVLRGEHKALGRSFTLFSTDEVRFEGILPSYVMPSVKNAAGYYAADDMDLIDLFIGSEGTLGVVVEAELELIPLPRAIWGIMSFLPDEAGALRFVRAMRGESVDAEVPMTCKPAAIEFFDERALDMLRKAAIDGLPPLAPASKVAVYVELHGDDEDALALVTEVLVGQLQACGGSEDATWTAMDEFEMERLHKFRHAVPEVVNATIGERRRTIPGLTKLGTDMSVPDVELENVLRMYHTGLNEAKLEYVIFGHIGNNHVHVNILPRSLEEYDQGKALYLKWAETVIRLGGSVSAEHGIGKLKVEMLRKMYGDSGLQQMKAIKKIFDPNGRLNPGNLFVE
jgi:D-lactate dehydrogenase (cytochrome)